MTELIRVENLKKHFPIRKGILRKVKAHVKAVDGVSFSIHEKETIGLVGESGCGKTTAGRSILKLLEPTEGSIEYREEEITHLNKDQMRPLRRKLQIIFQDPYASLNPRMTVGKIIREGLDIHKIGMKRERDTMVAEVLERVGLPRNILDRYPHEFSGGQRQRVGIARALALKPRVLVADEPTSALDVSVQAQVLNLLKRLQAERNLAYLFITHDMAVVSYLADDIAVMYLGEIVERGPAAEVLNAPKHPYTQALLSAMPRIDDRHGAERIHLAGDLPSPANPPPGCRFNPRCPHVMDRCKQDNPEGRDFGAGHTARCHLY